MGSITYRLGLYPLRSLLLNVNLRDRVLRRFLPTLRMDLRRLVRRHHIHDLRPIWAHLPMEVAVVQAVKRGRWVEVKAGGNTSWEYLGSMQRMKKRTMKTYSASPIALVCPTSVTVLVYFVGN